MFLLLGNVRSAEQDNCGWVEAGCVHDFLEARGAIDISSPAERAEGEAVLVFSVELMPMSSPASQSNPTLTVTRINLVTIC